MQRILWGVILVVVGALFALQTFGLLSFTLPFWSVVLAFLGLYLFVSSLLPSKFRWRPGPSWFKLSIGAWLAGIGVFDILHVNGISELAGRDVWSVGWFVLLIGIGLALIFGRHRSVIRLEDGRRSYGWESDGSGRHWVFWPDADDHGHALGVGDLHYGREPWSLDGNLTVRHRAGDIRIDLTTAEIGEGSHDIDVSATVGEIAILVPEHCNANVRARVSTGAIKLFEERREGLGVVLEKSVSIPEATTTLNIDIRLRAGQVSVRRVPSR